MTNSKTIKTKNTIMDWEIQTILLITLNLYDEKYFMTEWKDIFEKSKKKKLQETNISQVMSRKPKYSHLLMDPRVMYVENPVPWVRISEISSKWKLVKIENTTPTSKVNHKKEMQKYMDIYPEVSRVTPKSLSSDKIITKNPKWLTKSQANFRPQRFQIRRNQF